MFKKVETITLFKKLKSPLKDFNSDQDEGPTLTNNKLVSLV